MLLTNYETKSIFLYNSLDGETILQLYNDITTFIEMYNDNSNENIDLSIYINSAGGNIKDALSLYKMLKNSNLKIETIITCICYSAAILLFLAGVDRIVYPWSTMLIHDVSVITGSDEEIKKHELIKYIEDIEHSNKFQAEIYSEYTTLSYSDWYNIINKDEYVLNGKQIYEHGFANIYLK